MAYQPPKQSLVAQIFDVIALLVLTVGALYLPLYLGLAGAAKTPEPDREPDLGSARPERHRAAAMGGARHHRSGGRQRHHHGPLRLLLQLGGADHHGGSRHRLFRAGRAALRQGISRSHRRTLRRQAIGAGRWISGTILEYAAWALSFALRRADGLRPGAASTRPMTTTC